VSLPLGAGRLTRDLLRGDPPPPDAVRQARRVVRQRLAAAVRPISKVGPVDRAVGTSKTMRSLARIAGAAPSSEGPYAPRWLARDDVTDIVGRVSTMTAAQRAQLPGVSRERSRQLLAGALVAEAAMDLLDLERLDICPWALREGVLLDRLDAMR
jgi:exopolyphosphatase/guanosine-5'-triphosphate,3'-diphosphate pyrophosphatase